MSDVLEILVPQLIRATQQGTLTWKLQGTEIWTRVGPTRFVFNVEKSTITVERDLLQRPQAPGATCTAIVQERFTEGGSLQYLLDVVKNSIGYPTAEELFTAAERDLAEHVRKHSRPGREVDL